MNRNPILLRVIIPNDGTAFILITQIFSFMEKFTIIFIDNIIQVQTKLCCQVNIIDNHTTPEFSAFSFHGLLKRFIKVAWAHIDTGSLLVFDLLTIQKLLEHLFGNNVP